MPSLSSPTRNRRDAVSIPTIWIALLVSVLVHVAVMWKWPVQIRRPSSEIADRNQGQTSLSVQLAPKTSPPPPRPRAPAVQAQRAPAPRPRQREAPPRARPSPPVIALNKPVPVAPSAPPKAPVPAPARPAAEDMASYIEAKRRARGESAPAAPSAPSAPSTATGEDENARANRIAAANLGADRKPTFGSDPRRGGGIFQIQRMSYDYAEFVFFGWNKDIRRNTTQLIEVRKGNNSDIKIAVVRRMIAIIREHEDGDFVFESKRLGRNVTLSARSRDNSGLEDFMMREFFEEGRP